MNYTVNVLVFDHQHVVIRAQSLPLGQLVDFVDKQLKFGFTVEVLP